jgi:DNA-binding NtrC family response regulator
MSVLQRREVFLVVDDHPVQLATMRELLEAANFDVLTAESREEALRLLDANFVDLLLLDERIGRASGTKLLETCRTRHPGISGILITGYADLECAVAGMRAGALDLLQKPIRKEQLLAAIGRALSGSQRQRLPDPEQHLPHRGQRGDLANRLLGKLEPVHRLL